MFSTRERASWTERRLPFVLTFVPSLARDESDVSRGRDVYPPVHILHWGAAEWVSSTLAPGRLPPIEVSSLLTPSRFQRSKPCLEGKNRAFLGTFSCGLSRSMGLNRSSTYSWKIRHRTVAQCHKIVVFIAVEKCATIPSYRIVRIVYHPYRAVRIVKYEYRTPDINPAWNPTSVVKVAQRYAWYPHDVLDRVRNLPRTSFSY